MIFLYCTNKTAEKMKWSELQKQISEATPFPTAWLIWKLHKSCRDSRDRQKSYRCYSLNSESRADSLISDEQGFRIEVDWLIQFTMPKNVVKYVK